MNEMNNIHPDNVTASETEVLKQYAEIFRLITRMNQRRFHAGNKKDPELKMLTEEMNAVLSHTADNSPEREALLSAYNRMMDLPTHQEDFTTSSTRQAHDADTEDILRIFR